MSKNLVDDFFAKNQGYEVAAFCTFGLNLNFLESYLLRLDGIDNCDSISIFTDSSIYEAFTSDINNYHPRWINRKYLVTSYKTKGIFHPKVYLMASEKKAQIAIGSANLTREGITSNLEIISLFEVSEKNTQYSKLLGECVMFFNELAKQSKSRIAQERMRELADVTTKLIGTNTDEDVRFINNLDKPLLNQVQSLLAGKEINKIKVLSPFYDKKLKVISELRKYYPETTIQLYLQQDKSNFPVEEFLNKNYKVDLFLYKGIERYMHGKALLFEDKSSKYLLTGSANFTESALMRKNNEGNIEAGLFGMIEEKFADELFTPTGISGVRIKRPELINTTRDAEEAFIPNDQSIVHYLLEAQEDEEYIILNVDEEVLFTPTKIILYKLNEKIEIEFNTEIDLKQLQLNQKDVYAVQAVGTNDKNKEVGSNTVWILRLEKKDNDKTQKKYRRILNSPYELINVLNEIISRGDEKELKRFLMTFDVPLDLMLMPSNFNHFFQRQSKGNVVGELQQSKGSLFEMKDIKELFQHFLKGLLQKLYLHYDNIQLQKLPNFMLIFATLLSMIEFINTNIYEENRDKIVEAKRWSEIREYYNMLIFYIGKIWTLLWIDTKEYKSFDEKVNSFIKKDKQKILGDIKTFEEYIIRDYLYIYEKAIIISENVIGYFELLKNSIKIQTVFDTIVTPIVFQRDLYINEIKEVSELISRSKSYNRYSKSDLKVKK